MAEKIIGTTLQKTSGTPFYVANLTSLGEVGAEREEIEITNFDSPDDYREYVAGLKDAGELSVEGIVIDEPRFEAMLALLEAGTTETWAIEFPSGAKLFFSGFVKMWKLASQEVADVKRFTGAIRLTGKPVYDDNGVSA